MKSRRKNIVNLCSICCMVVLMASISARATDNSIDKLAQDARCSRGLDWIERNASWVTDEQIRMTQIPAPENMESRRADYIKRLFQSFRLSVRVDKTGNVVGEWSGSESKSVILLAAHLDTVFPAGTDVHVQRNGDRLVGPGISDNGSGLAALVAVARAISEARLRTAKTIAFAADVGEEGEGNLRGIRALVDEYGPRLAAVIAVDGPSAEHITTQGIASRRFEVTITGPGGHSWSDFGAPNPITALARGTVQFSSVRVSDDPRTSFNFGLIEGGTSVNSIPARAAVKVDLRSEDESELARLETALREAMRSGVKQEMDTARASADALKVEFRSLGSRPAGRLADNSPLLETILNVDRYLGNRSRIERSSTDANIPLSMGIPAVSLGGGGKGSGSHTLSEWYDPTGRTLGLKRLYLATIALAGLQP